MSWAYKETGEPWQKATRRGDWKLVLTGKTFELYNLRADISEKNNVAAKHPELVKELTASWNEWKTTLQFPHFPADTAIFPWEELRPRQKRNE